MKALLILGGRSTRFWPLTEKSLFPICGKTLLEHQIATLKAGGIKDITLVTGAHNRKEIAELLPKVPQVEQEDLELGMRGAALSALKKISGGSVIIVSANDVIDPKAIKDLVKAAAKKGVAGAILARKVDRYFPGGYLTLKGDKVTGIAEKPGEGNEPSDLVNIVAHVHNDPKALLEALRNVKTTRDDGYEVALQTLFADHTYVAVPYTGYWQAVKYPWHLLHLLPHFLEQLSGKKIHKSAQVHKTAVIEGDVTIEEGVRVLPHATIKGPCFVGKGTVIANNALVRGSSIGAGSVIGYSTEVKGSVLAGPVWTHMTYLGDSVVGKNVSFGGGCTTGNLRFDEGEVLSADPKSGETPPAMLKTGLVKFGLVIGDDCRLGIQVGSNPGVKVGAGTFIGSAAVITGDIPEKSFVLMKEGKLTIKPNKVHAPKMADRDRFRRDGKF